MSSRVATGIAVGVWIAGFVLRVVQLWLWIRSGPQATPEYPTALASFLAAFTLGMVTSTVGVLIVARRPMNTVGWILVAVGLLQAILGTEIAYVGLVRVGGFDDSDLAVVWASNVGLQALPLAFLAFLIALFPDGRFLAPRWRIIGLLAVVGGLLRVVELTLGAPELAVHATGAMVANPFLATGAARAAFEGLYGVGIGLRLTQLAVVLALIELLVRYGRSDLDGRRQIRWLLAAGFVVLAASVVLAIELARESGPIAFDSLAVTIFFAALCLPPIAIFVAITRYHLYEIDHIINRAILYGSLTAVLAGLFTAAIALAQRLFVAITGETTDAAIVITTLVVATAYTPIRRRLEAWVDRRFKWENDRFGAYRDTLDRALDTRDPERALGRLLIEGARELDASWGEAELRRGDRLEIVKTVGSRPVGAEPAMRVQVATPAWSIGVLVFGPRSRGRPYDERVEADLRSVAQLAAQAMDPRVD